MRVMLVDDHALFRDGLRGLLEAGGMEIVGEARNGAEAVEMAHQVRPEIVLMDLEMPEMGGLTATRLIAAELSDVKVVILTGSEDDADLFEAIKSGAQGFLVKNVRGAELIGVLSAVGRGEPGLSPALAKKVLAEFARPVPTRHERGSDELTEREQEVLELLVQGITSNRELAEKLVVSENTVKYHLRNILDKLHLRNRAQVVAFALRHGLAGDAEDDIRSQR